MQINEVTKRKFKNCRCKADETIYQSKADNTLKCVPPEKCADTCSSPIVPHHVTGCEDTGMGSYYRPYYIYSFIMRSGKEQSEVPTNVWTQMYCHLYATLGNPTLPIAQGATLTDLVGNTYTVRLPVPLPLAGRPNVGDELSQVFGEGDVADDQAEGLHGARRVQADVRGRPDGEDGDARQVRRRRGERAAARL